METDPEGWLLATVSRDDGSPVALQSQGRPQCSRNPLNLLFIDHVRAVINLTHKTAANVLLMKSGHKKLYELK